MGILPLFLLIANCFIAGQAMHSCQELSTHAQALSSISPAHRGESFEVVLSAQAALAWDIGENKILYEKNSHSPRPVASLTKLLSVLSSTRKLSGQQIVEIPTVVRQAQRSGADIRLPPGEHASVADLWQAALVASANDAAVTLAVATSGSEKNFVEETNQYARQLGLHQTVIANSTGLEGGQQHSTAQDLKKLLSEIMKDSTLTKFLGQADGSLTTVEGTRRQYKSTNQLFSSYLPIIAGKTGYTIEAGENLILITKTRQGHEIGVIVLGSEDRFLDVKVLVEWIERNYTW